MTSAKRKSRPIAPVPSKREREKIINSEAARFPEGRPEIAVGELEGVLETFEETLREFHDRQTKASAKGTRIPIADWKEVFKQMAYVRQVARNRVRVVEYDQKGTWVLWVPGKESRGRCKLFTLKSQLEFELERYKHTEEQPKIEFARRVLVLDDE